MSFPVPLALIGVGGLVRAIYMRAWAAAAFILVWLVLLLGITRLKYRRWQRQQGLRE